MDLSPPFTVQSAQQAAIEGRVGEWVGAFLASPGSDNALLAIRLFEQETSIWLGPLKLELARLRPMAGPNEGEGVVLIDEDEWEHDIQQMEDHLEEGWAPPPLLVSYHDGGLFLEDGNHRYESLLRTGETHAWAIVWFLNESDRAGFINPTS